MDKRTERVTIETDCHRITGDLTLPREGYRSRISDFLNRGDLDFVPLADAVVEPLHGESPPVRHPFLAVSRVHIRIAHEATDG